MPIDCNASPFCAVSLCPFSSLALLFSSSTLAVFSSTISLFSIDSITSNSEEKANFMPLVSFVSSTFLLIPICGNISSMQKNHAFDELVAVSVSPSFFPISSTFITKATATNTIIIFAKYPIKSFTLNTFIIIKIIFFVH